MADIFDQLDFEHLIFRERRHRIEDTLSEHLFPLRDRDLYMYDQHAFVPSSADGKEELSDVQDIEFGQSMQIETQAELVSGPSFYEPPMQMKDTPSQLPLASPVEEIVPIKEEPSITVETAQEHFVIIKRKRSNSYDDRSISSSEDEELEYEEKKPKKAGRNPKKYQNPSSPKTKRKAIDSVKTHRMLPKEATDLLKSWLLEHISKPYPTEDEKYSLMSETGLTLTSLNNWFTNARRRYLKKVLSQTGASNGI